MPKGTKVEKVDKAVVKKLEAEGRGEAEAKTRAAKIAQAKTGKSLATGKKPKGKS